MVHAREKHPIRWIGYVIMPEHVHLLAFPAHPGADEPVPISKLLQTLKQYVGRHGKQALRDIWASKRTLGSGPMDTWEQAPGPKPFWKTRAHDFNVTTEQSLHVKLDYMHKNPVTRGLVDRADQWRWSSYRFYEVDDGSVIAMDWDGSWPIT